VFDTETRMGLLLVILKKKIGFTSIWRGLKFRFNLWLMEMQRSK
jgi:hypothetical protein